MPANAVPHDIIQPAVESVATNAVTIDSFCNWIFFTIILALLPFLLNLMLLALSKSPFRLKTIFKDGELFFFSTAINASALGGIVFHRPKDIIYSTIIAGILVIVVIMSSCFFSLSSFLKLKNMTGIFDEELFSTLSFWCAVISVILSFLAWWMGVI